MSDAGLLVREDIRNGRPVSVRITIPLDSNFVIPRDAENNNLWLQCTEAGVRAIHAECGKLIEYIDAARSTGPAQPQAEGKAGKETA